MPKSIFSNSANSRIPATHICAEVEPNQLSFQGEVKENVSRLCKQLSMPAHRFIVHKIRTMESPLLETAISQKIPVISLEVIFF